MRSLNNFKKKLFSRFIIILFSTLLLAASIYQIACYNGSNKVLLATTTTVEDSGTLKILVKKFEAETGIQVQTIVAGSSEILRTAQMGNVDVILTHAPEKELIFMKKGYGKKREPIMQNYFMIAGPNSDRADIGNVKSIGEAFNKIYKQKRPFISRDDESGIHLKEQEIWVIINKIPHGKWYKKSGLGMGETLFMANDLNAYTLTDSASFLKLSANLKLKPLFTKKEKDLKNIYSVILADSKEPNRNAEKLYKWLSGNEAARIIRQLKSSKGQPLFETI